MKTCIEQTESTHNDAFAGGWWCGAKRTNEARVREAIVFVVAVTANVEFTLIIDRRSVPGTTANAGRSLRPQNVK